MAKPLMLLLLYTWATLTHVAKAGPTAKQLADQLAASFGLASTYPSMDDQDRMQMHTTQEAVDWRDVRVVRAALAQLGVVSNGWDLHGAAHELQFTNAQLAALKKALTELGVPLMAKAATKAATTSPDASPKAMQRPHTPTTSHTSVNSSTAHQRHLSQAGLFGSLHPNKPIGSGDNLLEYRRRVQQLKQYYRDARIYLRADDSVRIGGYIARLDRLGIQFTSAFPIQEVTFFTANLKIAADIVGNIFRILRVTRGAIDIIARSLALQIVLERARRAAVAAAAPPAAPSAGSRSAPVYGGYGGNASNQSSSVYGYGGGGTGNLSLTSPSSPGGSRQAAAQRAADPSLVLTGSGAVAAGALENMDSAQLASDLTAVTAQLQSELLPWAASGGLVQPLVIADGALRLAQASLGRMQQWQDPGGLLIQGAPVPGFGG